MGDRIEKTYDAAPRDNASNPWVNELPRPPQYQAHAEEQQSQRIEGPQKPSHPTEAPFIDYEKLAREIAADGQLPEAIKEALKLGVGHPGLDLDKLNELLKKHGMRVELKALRTGLQLNLYQNGELVDAEIAKTPAAKDAADWINGGRVRPPFEPKRAPSLE